jgi:cytochrome b
MRSLSKSARMERRIFRQLRTEMSTVSGFDASRTPRHKPKDVLGAIVTLAILGAFLLQVTNGLASQCRPGLNGSASRACSGIAAIADHSQRAVTLSVCVSAAMAVAAFIWYVTWGYKTKAKC